MKKYLILLYIISFITAYSDSIPKTTWAKQNNYQTQLAIEAMDVISEWFIMNGEDFFMKNGSEALIDEILNFKGLKHRCNYKGNVVEFTKSKYFNSCHILGASSVAYVIKNLHAQKIAGTVYEFWLIDINGYEGSDLQPSRRYLFYLTSVDSGGARTILKKSEQFFNSYKAGGDYYIFPAENNYLLYSLEAWKMPNHFKKHPQISNFKVKHGFLTRRLYKRKI